jgi:RNA recognition motif-containing protein
MKILVRNLARTSKEKELYVLFSAFGSVTECTLVLDKETGESKGFGFIEMPKTDEALAAIKKLNQSEFGKSKIRVKSAQ